VYFFGNYSFVTRLKLFKAFCSNMCGCELWSLYDSWSMVCVKLHLKDGRTDGRTTVRPSVRLLDGVWNERTDGQTPRI